MGRIADAAAGGPKVLVYDIETRPMVSFHWGARQQDISPVQVLDSGGVLCWAAKWLDRKSVMFASDHHDGHQAMVERLHELICAADIVVGYNQISFDDKRMNVEYRRCGLPVPTPVKSVDMLKAVRARFGFPINKLASVADELGLGHKLAHTGWDLWRRCCTDDNGAPFLGPVPEGGGDAKAWTVMRRYCKRDVDLTADVYLELLDGGWIKNHPHVGQFGGNPNGCPVCGSDDRSSVADHRSTTYTYPAWRCGDCGHVYRSARALPGTATGTRSI